MPLEASTHSCKARRTGALCESRHYVSEQEVTTIGDYEWHIIETSRLTD